MTPPIVLAVALSTFCNEAPPGEPGDSDGDQVSDAVERGLGTSPSDPSDVPPIPEPLVFDLMRNLGARRGEVEANVLTLVRLTRPRDVMWSPEIEVAFADGWAAELELPFAGGVLQSVKAGVQRTFGRIGSGRTIHGIQGFGEGAVDGSAGSATFVYALGAELRPRLSVMLIAGGRGAVASSPRAGVLANASVFAELRRSVTVGAEVNVDLDSHERARLSLMPQLHIAPFRHVKVQAGLGPGWSRPTPTGLLAVRMSIEL